MKIKFIIALFLLTFSLFPGFSLAESPVVYSIESLKARIAELEAELAGLRKVSLKPFVDRELKLGDEGKDIEELQKYLKEKGDFVHPKITGYFGEITKKAVEAYEKRTGEKLIKPTPIAPESTGDLTVLSPRGGEMLLRGQRHVITWSKEFVNPEDKVFIFLLRTPKNDGHKDFMSVSGTKKTENSLDWFVGKTVGPGPDDGPVYSMVLPGEYKIMVCYTSERQGFVLTPSGVCDQSDSYFTIYSGDKPPVSGVDPVISGISGPTVLAVGETGVWEVKAVDPAGSALTYAIDWGDKTASAGADNLPNIPGLTTNTAQKASFTHNYKTEGVYTVTFAVANALGNSAKSTITIKVGQGMIMATSTGVILKSDPPSGAVDARIPSNPDGSNLASPQALAWDHLRLTFDSSININALTPANFSIISSGVSNPSVYSVLPEGNQTVLLKLSSPISLGERTVVKHKDSGAGVCLGYLPGDVDGNGKTSGNDILSLIDHNNQVKERPNYSVDIDRNGAANFADQLSLINLINGADAFEVWYDKVLPACPV